MEISKASFLSGYVAYVYTKAFPFAEKMDEIHDDEFRRITESGVSMMRVPKKKIKYHDAEKSISEEFFSFYLMLLIFFGYLLSSVAFLCELTGKHIRLTINMDTHNST